MDLNTIAAYEAAAQHTIEASSWDYLQGGSDDEYTVHINQSAFQSIKIRPRILIDVSSITTATTVFGDTFIAPIAVAATAFHGLFHSGKEEETVRGAARAHTLMTVSTQANASLEEIAAAASGSPLWFQLYVYKHRAITEGLVRRAETAGYKALVLTVDTPVVGNRLRDVRNHFTIPSHLELANFRGTSISGGINQATLHTFSNAEFDQSLTWEAIDWLRSITRLPIVVKGILTAEDAVLAAEHGVAGIIVSNHGGRQLNSGIATIAALPEVANAVQGRCEVFMDGGIRQGSDVFKALALGAKIVFLGRPVIWGLAANGADGVQGIVEILQRELATTMALAGTPSIAHIDQSTVMLP